MNAALQAVTQHRILIVEAQVYSFVLNLCLPNARAVLSKHAKHSTLAKHSTHANRSTHADILAECACYENVHAHEKWLIRLTIKLRDMLVLCPHGFTVDSVTYLPNLEHQSTFRYIVNKFRNEYHEALVPNQKVLNVLKVALYQWLNIPIQRDAEYRCIMVDVLQQHLGSAVLYLPEVWNMCCEVPSWIYTDDRERQSFNMEEVPLLDFSASVQCLAAANPGTRDNNLLRNLWESYKKFIMNVRTGPKGLPVAIQHFDDYDGVLSIPRFKLLVDFLRKSLQSVHNQLPITDPFYEPLRHKGDFYLPLREFAPSRQNIVSQANTPFLHIEEPVGMFNLLVFRILCFNTQVSRTYSFDFTLPSLLKMMDQYEKKNKAHYHNSRAYGNPCAGWDDRKLMERYWDTAHSAWPLWVENKRKNRMLNVAYLHY